MKNLDEIDPDEVSNLRGFCEKVKFSIDLHPTAQHNKSEELLRTVYELGGLLPTQVTSEATIDGFYYADHLIELDEKQMKSQPEGTKGVVLEFEGPHHFIMD